jgi:endothelin-converting enzyme
VSFLFAYVIIPFPYKVVFANGDHSANYLQVLPNLSTLKVSPQHKGKSNICTTPECIHASSEILYNLSPNYKTIDPCSENLEEMICGGWRDRHDLRPDQGDAFTGTMMAESSQTLLRHILEAPYPQNSKVWIKSS